MVKAKSVLRTPYSGYVVDIGVECHVQLKTASKLFCSCSNDTRGAEPNTTVCPICFGLPGTLPVLNKQALELAIQAGTALNSEINQDTKFDRKNYFYPDLPKGYQITQYDEPIVGRGEIEAPLGEDTFTVGITRAHMEEDAGKLIHPEKGDYSLVDLNRAGTPLLEIVSEPHMHSPAQAKAYAQELYYRMLYAEVSDVDLYHGNMRFDLNISVREHGSETLGTRTETKNLNSFRNVEHVAEYEIKRQIDLLKKGESVTQETRGWDEQKTYPMRSKEDVEDYRYFPEPDIPPLIITQNMMDEVSGKSPKLVTEVRSSLLNAGLSRTQIEALINEPRLALLQLEVIEDVEDTKLQKRVANWLSSEVVAYTREESFDWSGFTLGSGQLQELAQMAEDDELSSTAAKQVLYEMMASTEAPRKIAEDKDLLQMSDTSELEVIIDRVINDNPKAAQDVRDGEGRAIGFLVGQVMKESSGQANPQVVKTLLNERLNNA